MEKLDDGTIIYDYNEAKEVIEKIGKPKITATEAILLLLSSTKKPVYGRTLLFKELFLLEKEILEMELGKDEIDKMQFVPFRFGPYSFRVGHLLDELELLGLIERRGKRNTRAESFSITEKGEKLISGLVRALPDGLLDQIRKLRIGWDELGTDGILRYVYQHYPEYKERSDLKEKYKTITWGRGRG